MAFIVVLLTYSLVFFFLCLVLGYIDPQKALFWLKTTQEKTKTLSFRYNGFALLGCFVVWLFFFEISGERARIEKENAEKEKQTNITSQQQQINQAQDKQDQRQEQEAQEREEERKEKLQAKKEEAKEKPNAKDDEFFKKVEKLKATQRAELKELEICEKNTLAQTEKENGKWSSDWDDATKAVYSKRRSQLLDICVNALLAKYNITRNKLSEYEAEQMKKEIDLRKEHYSTE